MYAYFFFLESQLLKIYQHAIDGGHPDFHLDHRVLIYVSKNIL